MRISKKINFNRKKSKDGKRILELMGFIIRSQTKVKTQVRKTLLDY